MAKNARATTVAKESKEVKIITIKDLAEQYELEPRQLRAFIRSLGIRAPEIKQEGFGPRAKYEWAEDSKELKQIVTALEAKLNEEDAEDEAEETEAEVEEAEEVEEAPAAAPAKKRRK